METSGTSQAAYCREHGLNAMTFGNWLRIDRNGCEAARSSALVPATDQTNASAVAYEVLQRIGKLYAAEAEGKHLSTEARQQLRAEKSLPILQSLHDWLLQTRAQTVDGGDTAKAIDYTLKLWQSLIRYASSGHLPIDNNPVENTIRPIALGKKNWRFTGSKRAGK